MDGDSASVDMISASTLHPLAKEEIIASLDGNQHRASGFSEPSFLISQQLESRRKDLENLLGNNGTIWFTSSADESATWAIRGLLSTNSKNGNKIDVKEDAHISLINAVKRYGGDSGKTVIAAASAMDIETGRILNLEEWNDEIINRHEAPRKVLDARGAIGRIALTQISRVADAIILDSESFGGPMGIGALWVRKGVRIQPLIEGSGQEKGRRGGTVPVGLVNAFVKVAIQVEKNRIENTKLWNKLHGKLESEILQKGGQIFAEDEKRAPGITCLSLPGPPAEIFLQHLEQRGFIAAPSSGCTATAGKPSHVLTSMGIGNETALRAIRISLQPDTSKETLEKLIDALLN
ncbi:MAG: aminotransferase class V-fold PLP-dependent enzyme [Candidatus Thermoplasmatota archaeon]|nr:aminotransferase class V-fold PLP-dependent enzyme [Candidatus Thermoplasmatota archaeon]MEC7544334.1 aminotransferase class V-fold PLP-dependent enzyme [Candidatus Thermoplasmatota archaeon]MEC8384687.1 aminotransferase class V-fold PLP-dependent enzyme [Candidatus Thermoplasmatota archaeon]MEC9119674.1 aminotransferase class V-fold PLP-dependent enzyme [Candidatus Thermoplasmatota archaeon]MEE3030362.1 aminotransferase class V-fold PLP-dependent enzyme [Candidatus Thermoplasmatota archaeon